MEPSGNRRASCTAMETTPLVTEKAVMLILPPGFSSLMEQFSLQHAYSKSVAAESSPRASMSLCVKLFAESQSTRA